MRLKKIVSVASRNGKIGAGLCGFSSHRWLACCLLCFALLCCIVSSFSSKLRVSRVFWFFPNSSVGYPAASFGPCPWQIRFLDFLFVVRCCRSLDLDWRRMADEERRAAVAVDVCPTPPLTPTAANGKAVIADDDEVGGGDGDGDEDGDAGAGGAKEKRGGDEVEYALKPKKRAYASTARLVLGFACCLYTHPPTLLLFWGGGGFFLEDSSWRIEPAKSASTHRRLNLQHYLWKDQTGFLLHPAITLDTSRTDLRIADVGTGTGCVCILPYPPSPPSLPPPKSLTPLTHKTTHPPASSSSTSPAPCRPASSSMASTSTLPTARQARGCRPTSPCTASTRWGRCRST